MSAYDGDKINYIEECIQSIIAQNFNDFEVVLINDGITKEELRQYIESLKEIDPRIKIYENEKNSGLAASMNNAISKAKGKYLARMDSDDIMLPDRLQKQVEYLEQHPEVDIVGSFYKEINDSHEILNEVSLPIEHKKMIKSFPRRNPLAHVSVMMRQSFIQKSGLYPTHTITDEDTLMWVNGAKNGAIMANIPEYLLKVRVSDNFYKRRAGFKKALQDAKNRIRVIEELKLSRFNLIFVFLRFVFQINPFTTLTYLGYKYLRK